MARAESGRRPTAGDVALALAAVAVLLVWALIIAQSRAASTSGGGDERDTPAPASPASSAATSSGPPSATGVTAKAQRDARGTVTLSAGAWSASLGLPATPGSQRLHQITRISLAGERVGGLGSSVEYAFDLGRDGRFAWAGSSDGYEKETDLKVTVDGKPVADKASATGRAAVVERTSELGSQAVDGGATPLAKVVTTYTADGRGLTVSWRLTWVAAAQVRQAYVAMLPVSQSFAKAKVGGSGSAKELVLDKNDGQAAGGVREKTGRVTFQGPGGATLTLDMPDVDKATDSWKATAPEDGLTYVDDRRGGTVNKAYVTRVSPKGGAVDVAADDVWESSFTITATKAG